MRYFITLAYNGTNYHGWQIQPNANSVQETLEQALSTILGRPIFIVGAGRTDTGVHAKKMIAHFDVEDELTDTFGLVSRLNKFLPPDISINKIERVSDDLHARFSAISRTYKYYITTQKNPFTTNMAWQTFGTLDFDKMNEAARCLFNYIDFTSFSKLHTDTKTNNCKIMQAEWTKIDENEFVFTIRADRFLRNMVRAIVGTLVDVGRGKISIDEFCKIIEKKDRCSAGSSMPAHALFLVDVEYPQSDTKK